MSLLIPGALTEKQLQELKKNWKERGVIFPDNVTRLIQSLELAYQYINEIKSR